MSRAGAANKLSCAEQIERGVAAVSMAIGGRARRGLGLASPFTHRILPWAASTGRDGRPKRCRQPLKSGRRVQQARMQPASKPQRLARVAAWYRQTQVQGSGRDRMNTRNLRVRTNPRFVAADQSFRERTMLRGHIEHQRGRERCR